MKPITAIIVGLFTVAIIIFLSNYAGQLAQAMENKELENLNLGG